MSTISEALEQSVVWQALRAKIVELVLPSMPEGERALMTKFLDRYWKIAPRDTEIAELTQRLSRLEKSRSHIRSLTLTKPKREKRKR